MPQSDRPDRRCFRSAATATDYIAQLANALEAVISQRLLPSESGGRRVLATEVLVANTAVRATIRERWEQIVGLIEIGARTGCEHSMIRWLDFISGVRSARKRQSPMRG